MPRFDDPLVHFDDPLVHYDDERSYQEILNAKPHHPMCNVALDLDSAPSGQKIWVRLRACNARGKSNWSDPTCIRVP